jgi:uncharacterized protein YxjI
MRYVMKQKILSITDRFTIKQENGEDVFQIKGKLISIGKKLKLQDMQGNEIARIKQKLISLTPTYQIYRGDKLLAQINKRIFTVLRDKFNIQMKDGAADIEVTGNILDHEYIFKRNREKIAEVSKKWISLRDSYAIEIAEGEDEVLLLACAVVIDMIAHSPEPDITVD